MLSATALAATTAAVLAGCASGTRTTTALPAKLTASGVARAPAGSVSPLSVAVAMAMVRAGAAGSTAAQIDAALHFPGTERDAAMNALTLDLATRDTAPPAPPASSGSPSPSPSGPPPAPILTIANGLFVQHGLQIGQSFLRTMAADYGAGMQGVDFQDPSAAATVNAWVQVHTAGRITKLFDSIDPSTLLVLADAVYLKAWWAVPFETEATTTAPFTRADGSTVAVPTMHMTEALRYVTGPGWQAVELPYYGTGDLAMWVLLPTTRSSPTSLLDPDTLAEAGGQASSTGVRLALPRWSFSSAVDLVPALQALGVHDAFSTAADFSAITPGLFIKQAVHRATITVDESGTEAAAATGIAMAASSIMGSVTTTVDHPFAFAVVQQPTGAVLFEGTVGDPSAN